MLCKLRGLKGSCGTGKWSLSLEPLAIRTHLQPEMSQQCYKVVLANPVLEPENMVKNCGSTLKHVLYFRPEPSSNGDSRRKDPMPSHGFLHGMF